jgi:hypothetical protein
VPGILIVGRHWMLRTVTYDAPEMLEGEDLLREEMAHTPDARCADQVRGIFELAGIEYGRMDYAVVDGRVPVLEINSASDLLRFTLLAPKRVRLRPVAQRISAGLYEAFAALDRPA